MQRKMNLEDVRSKLAWNSMAF